VQFRAKFLFPENVPHEENEPTLTRIHEVYIGPDGRVEGQDNDLTNALLRRDEVTGKA
jgi:hypothetical protein